MSIISDEQANAIGEVIQFVGLCHAQIGVYGDGYLYVYTQKRYGGIIQRFYIDDKGSIRQDSPFSETGLLTKKDADGN